MLLLLIRKWKTENYTIGQSYIDRDYFCDTLEDKVRPEGAEKVDGETAIPSGIYKVVLNWSPKFKRELPLLLNVPGFTGIRIHAGNIPEDSSGCILIGENKKRGMVINSRKYEKEIVRKMKLAIWNGDSVMIEIRQ